MTDKERNELRAIQDRFLNHPLVRKHVAEAGENTRILWGNEGEPTYAEVRRMVYPNYREWFLDFLRSNN